MVQRQQRQQTKQWLPGTNGSGRGKPKRAGGIWGVAELFYIFIVVLDTQLYASSKFIEMCSIKTKFCCIPKKNLT